MNATRSDILISRLIDGEASTEDWQQFSALAAGEPELWRELAEAQQQQRVLTNALAEATQVAANVELPDLSDDEAPLTHALHVRPRAVAWVGWAVAAVMAFMLWSGLQPTGNTGGGNTPGVQTAGANLNTYAPDELLQAYLDKGKDQGNVLGELPDKVLVETRPDPAGEGYEVLYIRTILERTSVPELYEFGAQDEAGRPVLAKFDAPPGRPM